MIRFRLNAEVQVKFESEETHSSRCYPTEQCRFRRGTRAWLSRSIIVPMLLGSMEVSALLPSAALADDSLSQIKPKLVYNTRAATRDGTTALSSERGGAMCGIMCGPVLIVALNVAALALFLLPAMVGACVTLV